MLTPSLRLSTLGVVMLVALTICSRNFSDRGGLYFMASLAVAGLAYLLAIRELFAHCKIFAPRHSHRSGAGRPVAYSIFTHAAGARR